MDRHHHRNHLNLNLKTKCVLLSIDNFVTINLLGKSIPDTTSTIMGRKSQLSILVSFHLISNKCNVVFSVLKFD